MRFSHGLNEKLRSVLTSVKAEFMNQITIHESELKKMTLLQLEKEVPIHESEPQKMTLLLLLVKAEPWHMHWQTASPEEKTPVPAPKSEPQKMTLLFLVEKNVAIHESEP